MHSWDRFSGFGSTGGLLILDKVSFYTTDRF
jgi:hypothetical protein